MGKRSASPSRLAYVEPRARLRARLVVLTGRGPQGGILCLLASARRNTLILFRSFDLKLSISHALGLVLLTTTACSDDPSDNTDTDGTGGEGGGAGGEGGADSGSGGNGPAEGGSAGSAGSSNDEYERPEGARELVSDEQLALLEEIGAVIYPGNDPPQIAGVYSVTDGEVTYHDNPNSVSSATDYTWTVEETDNPEIYDLFFGESGEGQGTYISGEDDCFTLYGSSSRSRAQCEFEVDVEIFSGCLTEDGIDNMKSAHIGGPNESLVRNACEDLIDDGLIPGEGQRGVVEYETVTRIE